MIISGIYNIRNLINKDIYIGSAVSLTNRFARHKRDLSKNQHQNRHLQRAVNKYGIENFIFEVIYSCPKEYLIKLEQKCIDVFKPKYNICKIAGSSLGIKRSEEYKKRMSESKKNPSQETRDKISLAAKNQSKESREKINNALKRKIIQIDLDGNFIKEWDCALDVKKELKISNSNISQCCRGNKNYSHVGGFKWIYKNES